MTDASQKSRVGITVALGFAQMLAWASSYYLIAILGDPMAQSLNLSSTTVFAAFSVALLVSGLIGPKVGRTIDLIGGRGVLAGSNLVYAAALVTLACAYDPITLWAGWLLLGVGMGLGLYDAAFATLSRIYGLSARRAITGITLLGGLASTVGWPLSAWGVDAIGWRWTCLAWAAAQICIGLPLNLLAIPKTPRHEVKTETHATKPHVPIDRTMMLLGFAFAVGWMVSAGMAAHLPRLLEAAGATASQALIAASLIGPAQVIARLAEAAIFSQYNPLISARIAMMLHPIGAGLVAIGGGALALPFTFLHGAGNGILTIARGTVPLAVFGPDNYGYRVGLINAPTRIGQAAAPLAFGLLIEAYGAGTLVVSSVMCLSAVLAFSCVRRAPHNLS